MDRGYHSDQWHHGKGGGRGRGRWRGRGGYHGNREDGSGGYFGRDDSFDNQNSPNRDDHGRHARHQWNKGRGRPDRGSDQHRGSRPPGLKGKEIGLWYAARSKKKTREAELQSRTFIQMDKDKEKSITHLLQSIRTANNITPQPQQSYRLPSDDEGDEPTASCSQAKTAKIQIQPVAGSSNKQDSTISQTGNIPLHFDNDFVSTSQEAGCCDESSESDTSQDVVILDSWEELTTANEEDATVNHGNEDALSIDDGSCSKNKQPEDDQMEMVAGEDCMEVDKSSVTPEEDEDHMTDEPSDVNDLVAPLQLLTKEDEFDSTFLAEFYENQKANRGGFENLQELKAERKSLQRLPNLDKQLLDQKSDKEANNSKFRRMLQFRKKLPSYKMRKQILDAVRNNQVTVLSGETGCGKTTQVAQFILDDYIERGQGSLCHIACTQPRRISAISVAERVAEERAECCGGESVGYQIRLEHKLPREQGSIIYCTNGIMLKWLVSDPWLSRMSHVILDEIHERDLHSDFLMIILKDLIRMRPDMKLVLMSATLNAEMFSNYFGDCPMLNIPGFTYPVKEYLLEDVIEMTSYLHNTPPVQKRIRRLHGKAKHELIAEEEEKQKYVNSLRNRYSPATLKVLQGLDLTEIDLELVSHLIHFIHCKKEDGAILVFLPGWELISQLHKLLTHSKTTGTGSCKIIPLHSLMPTINQKEVFERPPRGVRKIVIATNIAETSITIDDVVYVIDCGKMKLKNFDPTKNISTLQPEWISRANARQRRGRAGRVQPGECYHLYTGQQESKFVDYQLPEILRTRLEELCLQIKLLRLGKIEAFTQKAMQPPSMEALHLALENLRKLNALDSEEQLTPLGYHLAKMPVDPQTGKMLLFAAMFCCVDPILTIAASLSFKDAFYLPLGKEKIADERRRQLADNSKSDHIMLANAYRGWERACCNGTSGQYCYNNFLSPNILKMLKNMRRQFAEMLYDMKFLGSPNPKDFQGNRNSGNEKLVKAIICAGLYPNVAQIKPNTMRPDSRRPVQLQNNIHRKIKFHPKSVNCQTFEFQSNWFVYHLTMKTSSIFLYDTSMVSPYPLLFFGGSIDVRKDNGQDCIIVDDWIIFRAPRRIAHLVKELRLELDHLLEYKIQHPGVTNWSKQNKEGALMHAISDLITTEEHVSRGT